jgi:Fic family protein
MYKYSITAQLLKNIKNIAAKVSEMNVKHLSDLVLMDLEKNALAESAFSSTSIEGNPLPLTEVKKIIKNRPKNLRDSEREVLNYNDALKQLNDLLKKGELKFDLKLILKIHKEITQELLPKSQVGKIRQEPVFVNDPIKRKTIYWPPDHKDVNELLENLLAFINQNRGEVDPIILAGLFHKAFVIIHPFVDGNGRTVRLATKALLADLGINTFHLFSFENYYNKQISRYFEKVGVKGDFYDLKEKVNYTHWLEYFSEGILDELIRVSHQIENAEISPANMMTENYQKILDYIKVNGFIRDSDYAKITSRAKATRTNDFNKLIKLNKIEKHGKGPSVYYKFKLT